MLVHGYFGEALQDYYKHLDSTFFMIRTLGKEVIVLPKEQYNELMSGKRITPRTFPITFDY